MFYYLLVHLHKGTNVSIIVKVLRTSELDLSILKVINHKRDTKTPSCLSVVGATKGVS